VGPTPTLPQDSETGEPGERCDTAVQRLDGRQYGRHHTLSGGTCAVLKVLAVLWEVLVKAGTGAASHWSFGSSPLRSRRARAAPLASSMPGPVGAALGETALIQPIDNRGMSIPRSPVRLRAGEVDTLLILNPRR
jgi:hypothetical protein